MDKEFSMLIFKKIVEEMFSMIQIFLIFYEMTHNPFLTLPNIPFSLPSEAQKLEDKAPLGQHTDIS